MSASDKLDLTQFEGHTEGPFIVTNGTDIFPVGDTDARKHIADCDVSNAPVRGYESEDTDLVFEECRANAKLLAASPVLLAKLREAVELLRTANAFIIPKRNGEESEMQHRVNAFLATIHTGDQTNERE